MNYIKVCVEFENREDALNFKRTLEKVKATKNFNAIGFSWLVDKALSFIEHESVSLFNGEGTTKVFMYHKQFKDMSDYQYKRLSNLGTIFKGYALGISENFKGHGKEIRLHRTKALI